MESITLRDARPGDQRWLAALFADVRRDEFQQFGWSASAIDRFVLQQFEFQQLGYRARYPAATCHVIEREGFPRESHDDARIGRLWVDRDGDGIVVLDISVWSAWRGRGIGSQCLRVLIDEARSSQRPIRLQVAQGNPARRLYERLGFLVVDQCPPYFAMRWQAARVESSFLAKVCHEQA